MRDVNEEDRSCYQNNVLRYNLEKEVDDRYDSQWVENYLKEEYPTDRICMTTSDVEELIRFLNPKENLQEITPRSDIFFANTIPIKDCVIEWTQDNPYIGPTANYSFRVVVLPNYMETLQKADIGERAFVGMMHFQSVSSHNYEKNFLLFVCKGSDFIFCKTMEHITFEDNKNVNNLSNAIYIWYLIECAILNPLTKDVFAHSQRKRIRSSTDKKHSKGKSNKKAPIRYVQYHVIDADEIKQIESENSRRGINRKTMVWRVAGHWRHYKKSGKVIFIQPYWKGPARDKKKDIPPRDREIVTKIESA